MGQHHLLAPLGKTAFQLLAKQSRHRARTGPGIARPVLQRFVARGVGQHGLAEQAQALVLGQVHAQLHGTGTAQLVEQQLAQMVLACPVLLAQLLAVIGQRGQLAHHGAQQIRGIEHPALAPGRLFAGGHIGAATPLGLIEVQGAQIGAFHHGHGMLHARRHPQHARGRHDIGALRYRQAYGARGGDGQLPPGMTVRLDLGVGLQPATFGPHRTLCRGYVEMGCQRLHIGAGLACAQGLGVVEAGHDGWLACDSNWQTIAYKTRAVCLRCDI